MDVKLSLKDYLAVVIIFGVLEISLYFLKNVIGQAPNRKHEKNIEEIKSLKAHELQIDSYYRNISSEVISSLMKKWYLLAFDHENILTKDEKQNIDIIKEIINDTIAYGSKGTVKKAAIFQNYNYTNLPLDNKVEESSENNFIAMYLISYVVSSLKKDFTGEGIDADDLLKIKLTDYDKNKELLSEAHNKAKEILQQSK